MMKTRQGFSLLELLVALAILTSGIIIILQALSFCAFAVGISNDTKLALLLSKDKMQELLYKESSNQLLDLTDKGEKGKFRWEYALEPNPDSNLYKCDFYVTWERPNRKEALSLNTYLRR